jgi:vacuolar-type H+-ATPase subunit H
MLAEPKTIIGTNVILIESAEGLAGKYRIEIVSDGNANTEKLRDKLFNKVAENPRRFAANVARFSDYITWCRIISDRQTAVVTLRHFSCLTDEKISEATGYNKEEMDKIDNKFWPEIKEEMLKERNLTEEEYEEIIKDETPCVEKNEELETLLKEWYKVRPNQ